MADEQTSDFTIPGPVLRSVIQYLAARPYAEVAGLLGQVSKHTRPVEKPAPAAEGDSDG